MKWNSQHGRPWQDSPGEPPESALGSHRLEHLPGSPDPEHDVTAENRQAARMTPHRVDNATHLLASLRLRR